jgi:hypothetical protein
MKLFVIDPRQWNHGYRQATEEMGQNTSNGARPEDKKTALRVRDNQKEKQDPNDRHEPAGRWRTTTRKEKKEPTRHKLN